MTGRNGNGMDVTNKTLLVTGANRGIGRALVNEALRRGAKRVLQRDETMTTKSYTTSFFVDQSPEEVFEAINSVRGWWSDQIDGPTDTLGAEFTFQHKDLHRSTQKITELVPGKKVVWHITDSHIAFVKDKTEWEGTDVVFEITRKDGRTELRFTHIGLVPTIECYGDCSGAWSFLITDSLRSLITAGKGQPI